MDKGQNRVKVSILFPWFIILVLVLALAFVLMKHHGEQGPGTYGIVIRENEILSGMRLSLMRAAEAEKSSVLAITDEESVKFADQARIAATEVDGARKELASLIGQDNSVEEDALISEFDGCWTEFLKLDQLLLDLAVQNTNIRAANLAFTNGAEAVHLLERSLTRLIDSKNPEGGNSQVIRLAYQALVAGIKIHDLYAPHIEAETDEQMNRIEKDIGANEVVLVNSVDKLARIMGGTELDTVKDAMAAQQELKRVTREIISLSRKNTNIKSIRLSLGKKRLITAQCDEVLGAFQELIRGKDIKATR